MSKLRVAIIGLGMAAGHHARAVLALAHQVECVAAYSQTAGRRRAFSWSVSPLSADPMR